MKSGPKCLKRWRFRALWMCGEGLPEGVTFVLGLEGMN